MVSRERELFKKDCDLYTFNRYIFKLFIISSLCLVCILTSCSKKGLNYKLLKEKASGSNINLAIIDSGISLSQEENHNILYKKNCIDDSDNVRDSHGHGIKMFDESLKLLKDVNYIIIKVIDDNGRVNNDIVLKGLIEAEKNNAHVVNLSLGGYKEDSKITSQIKKMVKKNIIICASAGDFKDKDLLYPASLNEVISVGALDSDNNLWEEGNYDKRLDVAFPAIKNGKVTGTSEACMLASSYICLLKDYYLNKSKELSLKQIRKILQTLGTLNGKIDYNIGFK